MPQGTRVTGREVTVPESGRTVEGAGRMRRMVVTAAIGLTLAVGVGACSNNGDTTSAKIGKDKLSVNDKTGAVSVNDGKTQAQVGNGTQVPANFPSADVPLPDGTLRAAIYAGETGTISWTLQYQVADPSATADA